MESEVPFWHATGRSVLVIANRSSELENQVCFTAREVDIDVMQQVFKSMTPRFWALARLIVGSLVRHGSTGGIRNDEEFRWFEGAINKKTESVIVHDKTHRKERVLQSGPVHGACSNDTQSCQCDLRIVDRWFQ